MYAKALLAALTERPGAEAEIRKRFLATVARHGDAASFPKIIRELARLRSGDRHRVLVESARPITEKKLQEIQSAFGGGYTVETAIVPELVAGVRMTIDGEHLIDASIQGKAKRLFS